MATLGPYSGLASIDLATSQKSSATIFGLGQATVTSAIIKSGFNTWKMTSLVVDVASPAWFDTVIQPLRLNNTPLYFRIGIQAGSGVPTYTTWEQHILISAQQSPQSPLSNSPTKVFLVTADMLYFLNVGSKNTIRKGSISQMVSAIAGASSIPVQVESTTNSQLTLYQLYQTDFDFIRKRLLPRSLNQKGFGDYKFFIANGQLIFGTLNYGASDPLTIDYTSQHGQAFVYDLQFNDHVWEMFTEGSAGTSASTGNPYVSGTVTAFNSNSSASLLFATQNVTPTPTGVFTRAIGKHAGENPLFEIAAQAQNLYSTARNKQFGMRFSIKQNPFISLSKIVVFVGNSVYNYSGAYAISDAIHSFDKGVFTSVYAAIRDSTNPGTTTSTTLTPGYSLAGQPYGSTSVNSEGSALSFGQTTILSATDSSQSITVPISLVS